MTTRQAFWLLLGFVTLPLCFEATTGCDVVFPLEELDHNALRCDCSCESDGSASVAVGASADDAQQVGHTMDIVGTSLDLGQAIVGIRFDKVMIPAGATIQSATVQFTASGSDTNATNLTIAAEQSATPASFTAADDDLSGRTVGTSVTWNPVPSWANGATGSNQVTPELKTILQPVVGLSGWRSGNAIVLRIQGTGHRAARSFDGNNAKSAVLNVTYHAQIAATLPVCALPGAEHNSDATITADSLAAECTRVQATVNGLAQACTYPTPCTCAVHEETDRPDSFQSKICNDACEEVNPDATCSNFNPNAFTDCLVTSASVEDCKGFVAATNVPGDSPVCVASGSALAFHLFGRRSRCNVNGTSAIHVGDREPKQDPLTDGVVELLGGPCPGGGCSVSPFFDLRMDPITFAIRFHSDPTFRDLGAAGNAVGKAPLDGTGSATFAANTIDGTGFGRRDAGGKAFTGQNGSPLLMGVDWVGRSCTVDGNLATAVDSETPDHGSCDGDNSVECTADSPDCDDVGGPCVFDVHNVEQMTVDVTLTGTLVNQPPAANAGHDQTVECTSTAGASFTLDGRGSGDPDGNLALVSWRRGSRVGPQAANGLTTVQSLGVGASQTYVLRVIDAYAQTDEATTHVAVVDSTPPLLTLSVSPTTVKPPNHKLVTVKATIATSDVCDAAPTVRLLSITSNEPDNGLGDGDQPNDIQGAAFGTDDRTFELRAERGGVGTGRVYTITYESRDHSGNATVRQATVTVPH